jgi:hypothetical protein
MVASINPSVTIDTPRLEIGSRDKSVGWYLPTLESITDAQRDLLENYSKIAPERVISHLFEIVSDIFLFPFSALPNQFPTYKKC